MFRGFKKEAQKPLDRIPQKSRVSWQYILYGSRKEIASIIKIMNAEAIKFGKTYNQISDEITLSHLIWFVWLWECSHGHTRKKSWVSQNYANGCKRVGNCCQGCCNGKLEIIYVRWDLIYRIWCFHRSLMSLTFKMFTYRISNASVVSLW